MQRSYSAPPPMGIDTGRQYQALIHTTRGTVRIELLPKEAPTLVNNFVFLTRQRFYDGLTFHRVVPGFVAQGGDPTGTGFGGPGYQVQQDSNRLDFEAGVISMAKSNPSSPNVNGSQFFITLGPAPFLNGDFTVFGRVMEGLTVLRALAPRDGTQASQPPGERILSIEVLEQPAN
ncbi:MAG: peptidylprolyl isomerase [Dehalococcoidia bacterium]|nr:peptidylprolyl isomerase [Dehalococcoidia bacterium]